jgi:hypothetical protein
MTDFSDFLATLKEWANRGDWTDALVTSFVRNAEEKLNAELRIDRMISTNDALVTSRCAPVPPDWLEFDFIRLQCDSSPTGFVPIYYAPRAEFFRSDDGGAYGLYTIEGRTIYIGGAPNDTEGQTIRIDYYAEVPVFADDTPSWVYSKYQSLYRCAAVMHADLHAVGEEAAAGLMKQLAEDAIQKLNAQWRYARASGSRLARGHRRSFG